MRQLCIVLIFCLCIGTSVRSGEAKVLLPPSFEPTAEETLLLEYANRMRADPKADAERVVPKDGAKIPRASEHIDFKLFKEEMSVIKPAMPLVFNLAMLDASRIHADYMARNKYQGHDETAGKPGYIGDQCWDRFKWTGYGPYRVAGENAYYESVDMWQTHSAFVIDWDLNPNDSGGMQKGRMHRVCITDPEARETGMGVLKLEQYYSVVQNFGLRANTRFVGGVIYVDFDWDKFYSVGEGVGGVKASVAEGGTAYSWPSGAFTLPVNGYSALTVNIEFRGLKFTKAVPASGDNAKVDWVIPADKFWAEVDKLFADAERVKEAGTPAFVNARTGLIVLLDGIPLDESHRKRFDELTKEVRADFEKHQQAIFDALDAYDAKKYPMVWAEQRRAYINSPADAWFKDAEKFGELVNLVKAAEDKGGGKVPEAAKRDLLPKLDAAHLTLTRPSWRTRLEALIARVRRAG